MNAQAIQFDVLLRGPGGSGIPSVATIDSFKPNPDDLVRAERWFAARGVSVYKTEFGLSCAAPAPVFESIFQVHLRIQSEPAPGTAPAGYEGSLHIPDELRDIIDQVSLTAPPEFFHGGA